MSDYIRHNLAVLLAFAMVISEAARGIRELVEFIVAKNSKRGDDKLGIDAEQLSPKLWHKWSMEAAIIAPALVAVVYYTSHALIA